MQEIVTQPAGDVPPHNFTQGDLPHRTKEELQSYLKDLEAQVREVNSMEPEDQEELFDKLDRVTERLNRFDETDQDEEFPELAQVKSTELFNPELSLAENLKPNAVPEPILDARQLLNDHLNHKYPAENAPEIPGWEIRSLLGKGSKNIVWLGVRKNKSGQDEIAAIKTFTEFGESESAKHESSLLQELRASQQSLGFSVRTPIVLDEGSDFIATSLALGADLDKVRGQIEPATLIEVFSQFMGILKGLHNTQRYHVDFQLEDIFLEINPITMEVSTTGIDWNTTSTFRDFKDDHLPKTKRHDFAKASGHTPEQFDVETLGFLIFQALDKDVKPLISRDAKYADLFSGIVENPGGKALAALCLPALTDHSSLQYEGDDSVLATIASAEKLFAMNASEFAEFLATDNSITNQVYGGKISQLTPEQERQLLVEESILTEWTDHSSDNQLRKLRHDFLQISPEPCLETVAAISQVKSEDFDSAISSIEVSCQKMATLFDFRLREILRQAQSQVTASTSDTISLVNMLLNISRADDFQTKRIIADKLKQSHPILAAEIKLSEFRPTKQNLIDAYPTLEYLRKHLPPDYFAAVETNIGFSFVEIQRIVDSSHQIEILVDQIEEYLVIPDTPKEIRSLLELIWQALEDLHNFSLFIDALIAKNPGSEQFREQADEFVSSLVHSDKPKLSKETEDIVEEARFLYGAYNYFMDGVISVAASILNKNINALPKFSTVATGLIEIAEQQYDEVSAAAIEQNKNFRTDMLKDNPANQSIGKILKAILKNNPIEALSKFQELREVTDGELPITEIDIVEFFKAQESHKTGIKWKEPAS